MNYGKAVRIARAAKGLSQTEVAERANLAPSYVSRIERGSRAPRRETVLSIASALQVPEALLDFLAAPGDRLRGIDEREAATLGGLLLQLVVDEEPE